MADRARWAVLFGGSPSTSNDPVSKDAATESPRSDSPSALSLGPPEELSAPGEPLAIGAMLGLYRLITKLGERGMAAVYQAQHEHLDKTVALKAPPPHFTRRSVARFKGEMRAVGKLDHPNIVQPFDAGEIGGAHYLAMEFVEGTDLSKLVKKRGPLSVVNACKAIRQVCRALAAAHEAGLVHRDPKPANLTLAMLAMGACVGDVTRYTPLLVCETRIHGLQDG